MFSVKTLAAGVVIVTASLAGGGILANRTAFLAEFADEFAGTPVGDVATSARDLAAPVRNVVRSGKPFMAILDACPFDDTGWTGDADPLGLIRCGESYQVQFDARKNEWSARGPAEAADSGMLSTKAARTKAPPSAAPNQFFIWGADFGFDAESKILLGDGTPVGHLRPLNETEEQARTTELGQARKLASVEAAVRSGRPFRVVLDVCKVSDEGWSGDTDPLGTIKCGETYEITYLHETKEWLASGFNEGSGAPTKSRSPASDAGSHRLSIWGAEFAFDANLDVTVGGDKLGHLEITGVTQ